eukprot:GHVS01037635.1.p1 GENE.GHVS01037635.1~~GHVS01037635.1.p1  ORF type:complete len:388 (-),score=45.92 GHVS01037635.1:207-1370(-)
MTLLLPFVVFMLLFGCISGYLLFAISSSSMPLLYLRPTFCWQPLQNQTTNSHKDFWQTASPYNYNNNNNNYNKNNYNNNNYNNYNNNGRTNRFLPPSRLHVERGKNPYRQVISVPHDPQLHLFDSHHPEDTAQFQLIAKKIRMARAFSPCGQQVTVTIIQVLPATIVSFKPFGYCDVSYGKLVGQKKFIPRNILGVLQHYVSASHASLRTLKLRPPHLYVPGQVLDSRYLIGCRSVSVQGISKDKGFCGVMKRHGFKGGPATHGSRSHRQGGTIGDAGRQSVLPGTKMPGHVGKKKVTEFGKNVIGVNPSTNEVMLKGCIVGKKFSEIVITRFDVEESNSSRRTVTKTNDNIFVRMGDSPNMIDEEKRVQRIKQSYTDMDLNDIALG